MNRYTYIVCAISWIAVALAVSVTVYYTRDSRALLMFFLPWITTCSAFNQVNRLLK